ncbi:MAG: DbpA RNA binding domain-containing protein, partial [Prevotellaceae bacterium]|nr:DbpA RNA binding domain-containing protein [Prevotellaceae bacterium]
DFMPDIYRKLDWLSKEDLIKRMVSREFNRFSEYYHDREEIQLATDENPRAKRDRAGHSGKGDKSRGRQAEAGYTRLFINLGKKDGLFPNELMGLINRNIRGRVALGRIDIMQNFSFFEVEEQDTSTVLKFLNRANWNGRKVTVEVSDEGDGKREQPVREVQGNGRWEQQGREAQGNPAPEKPRRATYQREKPVRRERKQAAASDDFYSKPHPKKDDWKQFFQHDDAQPRTKGKKSSQKQDYFKGPEPDFSEEGWARRMPKKKK